MLSPSVTIQFKKCVRVWLQGLKSEKKIAVADHIYRGIDYVKALQKLRVKP